MSKVSTDETVASKEELLADALSKMLDYPEIEQAKLAYEAMLRAKTSPVGLRSSNRVYDTIILSNSI